MLTTSYKYLFVLASFAGKFKIFFYHGTYYYFWVYFFCSDQHSFISNMKLFYVWVLAYVSRIIGAFSLAAPSLGGKFRFFHPLRGWKFRPFWFQCRVNLNFKLHETHVKQPEKFKEIAKKEFQEKNLQVNPLTIACINS